MTGLHGLHVVDLEAELFACLVPSAGTSSILHVIQHLHLPIELAKSIQRGLVPYNRDIDDIITHGLYFRKHKWEGTSTEEYEQSESIAEGVLNDPDIQFKFVVTRHPWTRLISAYRATFIHHCKQDVECFSSTFGVSLMPSKTAFDDFVNMLTLQDPLTVNIHFRPITYLCELKDIAYEYIAEFEREADMVYIARRMGMSESLLESSSPITHEPSQLKFPCNIDTVHKVRRFYEMDCISLGYTFTDAMISCGVHGWTINPDE